MHMEIFNRTYSLKNLLSLNCNCSEIHNYAGFDPYCKSCFCSALSCPEAGDSPSKVAARSVKHRSPGLLCSAEGWPQIVGNPVCLAWAFQCLSTSGVISQRPQAKKHQLVNIINLCQTSTWWRHWSTLAEQFCVNMEIEMWVFQAQTW